VVEVRMPAQVVDPHIEGGVEAGDRSREGVQGLRHAGGA